MRGGGRFASRIEEYNRYWLADNLRFDQRGFGLVDDSLGVSVHLSCRSDAYQRFSIEEKKVNSFEVENCENAIYWAFLHYHFLGSLRTNSGDRAIENSIGDRRTWILDGVDQFYDGRHISVSAADFNGDFASYEFEKGMIFVIPGTILEDRVKCSVWTPDRPVAELPKEVRKRFREEAEKLLIELKSRKLDVRLYACEGYNDIRSRYHRRKRRVAKETNPMWYSELFRECDPHFERGDESRGRSFGALKRIIEGKDKPTIHYTCSRPKVKYVRKQRTLQYDDEGNLIRIRVEGYNNGYDMHYRELIFLRLTRGYIWDEMRGLKNIEEHGGGREVPPEREMCVLFGIPFEDERPPTVKVEEEDEHSHIVF